ncbi:MAG: gliding motility-associated C-terminal domain-containing protein [Cytophagaceae bacterium]|nr:MAG: gliding motility-associated C-terminal domain-containing protein [Cytophagaceae bacterium]
MKLLFTRVCCLLGGLVGVSQLAQAQITYTPVAVTGYTADVIADGTGPVASRTTNTIDRGNATVKWCFANTTYVNPTGQSPVLALPASGLLPSAVTTTPGLTFQLAPATANNSLRIDGAGQGTLTLTTPRAATEVVVLATEGNGSTAAKTFVVTFTDGTSQTFSNQVVPDWFNGATPAYIVGSRVSYVDNSIDNATTNPRLYQVRLALAATNYSKLVLSVNASKASTDPVLNVMGITLGATCQGVPNGGVAVAVPNILCPGQQVALTPSGSTNAGGLTFQWQASTDGGTTFTNVVGATSPTYIGTPTVTTIYQVIITCNGQSGTSTPVTVTVQPTTTTLAYATPPATASFCRSGTQAVVAVSPAGGTFSAGAGLSINATTGTLNLGASTAGTYTVTYTPPTGACGGPATATVTVTAPVTPTLTYGTNGFCAGSGTAAPTTVTPTGGTFSGSAGLIINATTGAVNLAATPAGTYTVSYTSAGTCSATATAPVTVLAPQVVTLSYGGTDFCKAGTNPTAAVTPAGGTFGSTTGLAINTATGAIDLNTSVAGTYTVTYTSAGQCNGQATARLTVKGNAPPTYPNILTPNGDGLNDVLRLYIADVQNYSLQVFSRWGRRVYEGHSATEGWSAADSSAGTYYYLVEYTDCAGRAQSVRNWLEVVK